eukprot:2596840-Prymnesium_polylepis.1
MGSGREGEYMYTVGGKPYLHTTCKVHGKVTLSGCLSSDEPSVARLGVTALIRRAGGRPVPVRKSTTLLGSGRVM